MKSLHMVSLLLVVVGALNWGLVGLFGYNLVYQIFGAMPGVENVIYIIIGLAGVVVLMDYAKKGKGKK